MGQPWLHVYGCVCEMETDGQRERERSGTKEGERGTGFSAVVINCYYKYVIRDDYIIHC